MKSTYNSDPRCLKDVTKSILLDNNKRNNNKDADNIPI